VGFFLVSQQVKSRKRKVRRGLILMLLQNKIAVIYCGKIDHKEMGMFGSVKKFLRLRSIQCTLRDCGKRAKFAATVHLVSGDVTFGRARPICGSQECWDKMKAIERVEDLRLTPIGVSIFSV